MYVFKLNQITKILIPLWQYAHLEEVKSIRKNN